MRKVQDFIEQMEARLAFGMVEDMSEKGLDDSVKEVFDSHNVARDTAETKRPKSDVHQVGDRLVDKLGEQVTSGEGQRVGHCFISLIFAPARSSKKLSETFPQRHHYTFCRRTDLYQPKSGREWIDRNGGKILFRPRKVRGAR
jgi:hypothetical protein